MAASQSVDRGRVVSRLRERGIEVDSVFDLVNSSDPYPEAVPVLLDLLEEGIEDPRVFEGVVRALAVKEAKGVAVPILLRLFQEEKDDISRWTIGNTLAVVSRDEDRDVILQLVRAREFGMGRQMLVESLHRWKEEEVRRTLVGLLNDESVAGHALRALRRQGTRLDRAKLEELSKHPNRLVQKEAGRMLSG